MYSVFESPIKIGGPVQLVPFLRRILEAVSGVMFR
jgi:hypothetical protein